MASQDGSYAHQSTTLLLSPPPSPFHGSETSFPILTISIVGMLTTAILLLSYYIFVTKCCLSWHLPDVLLCIFPSRRNRLIDDRLRLAYSNTVVDVNHIGLEESVIQAIPTLRFRNTDLSFHDCAVCLYEFWEEDKIRMLPNCFHVFHIDCIDTWLQSHSNCPLCRTDLTTIGPIPPILAPYPPNNFRSGGERVVNIEVRDDGAGSSAQETESSGNATTEKKMYKNKMGSVGDECIDLRGKDKEFNMQPLRRSFSMDSSGDRQLYMAVQEILQQNHPHFRGVINSSDDSHEEDGAGRIRRSFFTFGRGGTRSTALLSIQLS